MEESLIEKQNGNFANTVLGAVPFSEVYNEDCVEGLKRFDDYYFDVAIVDPPYGIEDKISIGGGSHTKSKSKFHQRYKENGKTWDKRPTIEFWEQLFRVSKNQIVCGANYFISRMPYDSACWLLFDKKVSEEVSFAQYEMAWTSLNGTCKKFDYRWSGMLQENMKDKEVRIHETQKPIALYDWIFSKYATEGMKVLDTHLGSGSSRISAQKNKLNFVGFEIDKDHFNNQNKRYENFICQLRLDF